jgi:stage III sporulation protein AA
LNFRISRQIIGCAEEIFNKTLSSDPKNVLICGGVNSGKTTLLRDLCRISGDVYKCVLIDERNELSASVSGIPMNNIGIQTDVLEGCCRSGGIITAVRNLSPDIIFCDEISDRSDADAILNGYGCGVNFVSTIHAASFDELMKREIASELIKKDVFKYAVLLDKKNPGKIREIRRLPTHD